MVLFVFVGSYYFLPSANKERLGSAVHWEADETARIRMGLWQAGLQMFQDHPGLGVGLANFPASFVTNYWQSSTQRSYAAAAWVPHSIYIEALSELGLAGSLPLAALLFLFFRLNARTRKHLKELGLGNRQCFEFRFAWGLDLAMVGYLVSGAFLTVLFYPHLWFLLGFSVAVHNICLRKKPESAVAPVRSRNCAFEPATG